MNVLSSLIFANLTAIVQTQLDHISAFVEQDLGMNWVPA